MAKNSVSFYLPCNYFFNPNGGNCAGDLIDVGPENSGKYVTRLKCRKCSRVIHIEVTDLQKALEYAKERAYRASSQD